jgi:hypothetical protein
LPDEHPRRPLPPQPRRARSIDPRKNWRNALAVVLALALVIAAIVYYSV